MAGLKIDGGDLVVSGSMLMTGSAAIVGSLTVNGTSIPSGGASSPIYSWTNTTYTQATAPGCDFAFEGFVIPGGTFAVGDILEVRSMDLVSGSNGSTYTNIGINQQSTVGTGSARPSGFGTIAQAQPGGDGKIYYQKTLYITSGGTQVWQPGNANEGATAAVAGYNDPIETYSWDWTLDQFVFYGACIDNSAGTLQNAGGVLRKIN
mgnify:FL=1